MIRTTIALKLAFLMAAFPNPHHHRHHRKARPMMSAVASEYGRGDGSTGGEFACGGTYTPGTVAVANRSLPCGTRLFMCFRRCAVVPIRDRGPFVPGRDFDLTDGAADATGAPWPAVLGEDGVPPLRWRLAQ
jgi:rare lipoprotein A